MNGMNQDRRDRSRNPNSSGGQQRNNNNNKNNGPRSSPNKKPNQA